jgi:general stress protein 26
MKYDQGNADELKQKFWQAFADSPFVFVSLQSTANDAIPMTASLDKDANHAVWFFTGRDNHLAQMGKATCHFASKGHDLFARFEGVLSEETSRERLDKQWSNFVEAWFPGGKDDPNLLFLRMDLAGAELWDANQGIFPTAKMALGMDVRKDVIGSHTEAAL